MKKVFSVLLVVTSLFALVGCGGKTENMQKEVNALKQSLAELQATVSTQSEQIGTLQGEKTAQAEKIAGLEAAKAAQAETIAALQNSANLSTEEIAALEAQLAEQESILDELLPKGAFCSLQTAYANGWFNDDVMKTIAYRFNSRGTTSVDRVVYNEKAIDVIALYAIKLTYIEYRKEYDWAQGYDITVNDLSFGAFYAQYEKYTVLCLATMENQGHPIIRDETIGNETFKNYNESFIYVWYPVEE